MKVATCLPLCCLLILCVNVGISQITDIKIKLTDSIPCTKVKDQAMSPTCWVFGTNSLFESDLLKKYNTWFDLSEMFIARHAYIDKAKVFLGSGGNTYFEGGGQFHDVIRIIEKYGMMPEQAYTGKPVFQYSHNHTKLDTSMKLLLNDWLGKGIKILSAEKEQQLNDTLDKYLTKVPPAFLYNEKLFTARTFADEVLKFKNEYIEIMSFADLPYYKKCLLVDKYNWAGDSLYNIPLKDLQMIVDTALKKGWSVGWEGDVTEKGFNHISGYAAFADSSYNYDQQRLSDFKNEATERDHMLHLVGLAKDEKGKKWYYLKNSWGSWLSKYKGYLFMEEIFFKLKTVIIMVNKAALPASLCKRLNIHL